MSLSPARQRCPQVNIQKLKGRRSLSAREAALMIEWATECEDPFRASELLRVFKELGGVQVVRNATTRLN